MFNLFKKKPQVVADNSLYAVANGEVINIDQVSDSVFSSKAMGEGFGVKPTDGNIVSPVAGTVTMVAGTKHALGFLTASGLEVLVHMGVDTVDLNGAPFKILVKVGDIVEGGTPIAQMDLEQVKAAELDNVVMTVITNTADKLESINVTTGNTTAGTKVGEALAK